MNIVKRAWNHPWCERFSRLLSLVVVIGIPIELWFVGGMNRMPWLFLLIVVSVPVMVLSVAIPAGWLSRDNLKRSWGWLFIRSK